MPRIFYLPDEIAVEVDEGEIILNASRYADIPHTHVCGGAARCSTCRVLVLDGLTNCSEPNSAERAVCQQLCFEPAIRLACQTQIMGDVTVRRLVIDTEDIDAIEQQVSRKTPTMPPQEKKVAILFADIRDFTTLSERLLPYDVMYILNRYFWHMGRVIQSYNGVINNYMGDGLMALFGVNDSEFIIDRAVWAGVKMLTAVEQLNNHFEMLYHQRLRIGIGIHYGNVVIGEVGALSDRRLTAIGDAVNLAARIETANKQLGTRLLISEAVYQQVSDRVVIGQSTRIKLKGKSGEYPLYEVLGLVNSGFLEPTTAIQRSPLSKSRWRRLIQKLWRSIRETLVKFFR